MNSKPHLFLSCLKSAVRIISCTIALSLKQWTILACGLGIAEILGLLEELGDGKQ
jgi:hypothetical protein